MKVLLAALGALAMLNGAALAEPAPAAAFGRIPAVSDVAISPDGQHLALLGGPSDDRTISIATLDKPDLPMLKLGKVEGVGLGWVGDDHVVVRVALWKPWTPQVSYRFERNVVVDLQAHQVTTLLEHDPYSVYLVEQPLLGVTAQPERAFVLGLTMSNGADSDTGSHLHQKSTDHPFVSTLFSVDPATGAASPVDVGSYDTVAWDLDAQGAPRVRIDEDDVNRRILVLRRGDGGRRYLPVWSADYKDRFGYFGYASADNAIYLLENDRVVRMNVDSGAKEPVGGAAGHVSPAPVWDPSGHKVVGVAGGIERREVQWLEPSLGETHALLSRAFKDKRVDLVDWSADETRFVVRVTSHDTPPVWYLYDKTRHELSPVGESYPELKGVAMGATRWLSFKARDGLEMGAYLTLPPGAPARAKLPLVVLPHGGPAARDTEDFDFITQFLATRGYAVLRPQFRGSWGFGQAFKEAGGGEWAGKMQTDLLDAVAAAAATGDVDPRRTCIVGASFGGYAAMAAAAFHSASYRCAVAIAGISDLGLLLNEKARVYGRDSFTMEALHGELQLTNLAQLQAASPARGVAGVSIPLLLIHGDQDTVVPLEQSSVMAKAMHGAGKPVDMIVLTGENHYLTRGETRTQLLAAVGDFLAKNLPVTP